MNIVSRKQCEFFGFTENHEHESILIFHECSSNLNVDKDRQIGFPTCNELHTGNTPRSIMTKGNSVAIGTQYTNFIRGNRDKLMISYRREQSHDYTMYSACGVLFQGEIHFFGGHDYKTDDVIFNYTDDGIDLTRQHFVIETNRKGKLVEMTKKEDLEIGFSSPSCSSVAMTADRFPWFKTNVVILCFDLHLKKSCHSFNGQLTKIGDSNYRHWQGGLVKYKSVLLTVGGFIDNQKTEIMEMDETKNFSWSIIESDFQFNLGKYQWGHSLVTVESSDINKQFVLLIGGDNLQEGMSKNVFKFNGTWFPFGQLNKARAIHNSIYWNGAVYVIGGANVQNFKSKTKMEIWKIKESSDQFKTEENWSELFRWRSSNLFIVPDAFFPDH